jgi:hypothetical protein
MVFSLRASGKNQPAECPYAAVAATAMHRTSCAADHFLTISLEALWAVACSHVRAGYPQLRPQSLGASAKHLKPLYARLAGGFRKFFA